MRTIKARSGAEIALDGDLLALLEALYRELTAERGLDHTYEDTMAAIHHLIEQMNEEERRAYLIESLFLNTVTYENEKAAAYLRRLPKD